MAARNCRLHAFSVITILKQTLFEFRIIEIRELKSYGGAKVTETSKLQGFGYQSRRALPEFRVKVYSRDDVVNVRMTNSRRERLHDRIQIITEIYEHVRVPAKPIWQLCAVCRVNQACQYSDSQPTNIRRYLWRLKMETLEEKGLNQSCKWKSKLWSAVTRTELGITDSGYRIAELESERMRLAKDDRPNVLPGDTVIVSGGNSLTTSSFTGRRLRHVAISDTADVTTKTAKLADTINLNLPLHIVLGEFSEGLSRNPLVTDASESFVGMKPLDWRW